MVYSSFYFLELNKYNITRNMDLKYFLSRVEARMLWFVLPRVKKKKEKSWKIGHSLSFFLPKIGTSSHRRSS